MKTLPGGSWRYLAILVLAWSANNVLAATITVNSNNEAINPGGVCTLRGAVDAINNGANANGCTATGAYGTDDLIRFGLGAATITLANTANNHIVIRSPLTIDGSGNDITLDGANANRIFGVIVGCTELTIKHLIFQNGNSGMTNAVGGAIDVVINSGQPPNKLVVEDSVFIGNEAFMFGGAINQTDGNSPRLSTLLVERSTFIGNTAAPFGRGGAIWAYNATIRNSTFSGNSAALSGGAVWADNAEVTNSTFVDNSATSTNAGAIFADHSLIASHLTLVNNRAPAGAAIFVSAGTGSLMNSLVVGDSSVTTTQCAAGATAALAGGTNLEWRNGANENSCNSSTAVTTTAALPEDIVDTVLADHGGPTLTLALPDSSPAIDAGDPSVGLTTDQRGQPRPQGGRPDLGAYEATSKSIDAAPIPSLGAWGLLALIGLVPAVACRTRRR